MNTKLDIPSLPSSVMMWTLNDEAIENHGLIERQFHDIRTAGFEGVAAFVRCSRYTWDDAESRAAFKKIGQLCKEYRFHCWMGLDPRFISRPLIKGNKGLQVICFGDKSRADHVPNVVPIIDRKFSVRCAIVPRPVHILNEVAVEFHPIGIYRIFAIRPAVHESSISDIIDITRQSHFFYNAREQYVEAFGTFISPDNAEWSVLAFFLFETNLFDYSNPKQVERYIMKVRRFQKEGIHFDGLLWDEPGYGCAFGTLPYSANIQRRFEHETGISLQKEIWKLAVGLTDQNHIKFRNAFYRIVQSTVNDAQANSNKAIQRFMPRPILFGLHDTWRFESADMSDMNHGSLDLWRASESKSGGFVDLGSVNLLKEMNSSFYSNLAGMSVIGASLGRHHGNKFTCNNLWTTDEDRGEGWQMEVMDHCVNVMALFGTHWLAHIYGPSGIVGEENSFLGLPYTPGYPQHSTWHGMRVWNNRIKNNLQMVQHGLPEANILLVYPVESMYALADGRASEAAKHIFDLLLGLTDTHYQIDIVSSQLFSKAASAQGRLLLDNFRYDAVIYPYPDVIETKTAPVINAARRNMVFVFSSCVRTNAGKRKSFPDIMAVHSFDELVEWLTLRTHTRLVRAPVNSWVTITRAEAGWIVSLAPSRRGRSYEGDVTFQHKTVEVGKQTGLINILFSKNGSSRMMDSDR